MTTAARRVELVNMVYESIETHTTTPSQDMIAMGTALIKVGETLEGVSAPDAKAVMRSVMELYGIEVEHGS